MIRPPPSKTSTIYMDYQGSTPIDPRVHAEMMACMRDYVGNPHANDHAAGWRANEVVERSAERIGAVLGCDRDEVIFTSGATEANNLALLGTAEAVASARRTILVSAIEHKSVLESAALAARRHDMRVRTIAVDAKGFLCLDDLERKLGSDVLLVSVMAVNNEVGSVQWLSEIAELCHERGALVHSDAAHGLAVGGAWLRGSDVDLLSLSGHKVYGPTGVGALVVRRKIQERMTAQIVGGGQQYGLRAGTVPGPLCAGLAYAVELMDNDDAEKDRERIAGLRNRLAAKLLASGGGLNGPPIDDTRHPGNLNIRLNGWNSRDLLGRLQPHLAISAGSACHSGNDEPSHVLRAMGLSDDKAAGSVRISLGRFSTEAEVDRAAALLVDLWARPGCSESSDHWKF